MTQPAPHYQPYQPLPPGMGVMAPPKPSGGGLTSLLAGILALVVAGIAVGGSFAPVTNYRNSYEADGDVSVYDTTVGWWGYSDNGSTSPMGEESSLYGLGLVLVAVLVVMGAVFAFVASRSRASGPTTGGRSLITAGVGVLAGLMLVQSLSVLEQASSYNEQELEAGESLDFSAGLGLVLPLCALGLGLVAVVLAHVGQRQRAFRVEPNTPRMGFPAPYGYQRQGAPVGAQAVAAPVVAAPTPPPSDLEDNSGETTQVVSNATASGTAPASDPTPDSVSAALSGDAPAAPEPPAPITPPASIAPPLAGAPASPPPAPQTAPPAPPAAPAAPAAPESPTLADAAPQPPTAAPTSPATDPAPTAGSAPDLPSPATTSSTSGTEPASAAEPEAQRPASEPSAPTPPTATPASAATPSEPTPPPSQPTPPAAPSAPSQPDQPSPLSGLPAAPPAPELTDEADKNKK